MQSLGIIVGDADSGGPPQIGGESDRERGRRRLKEVVAEPRAVRPVQGGGRRLSLCRMMD
jgi:hypothetical protein